jgi:hypothetical protein
LLKKTRDRFHRNFIARLRAHPKVYKRVDLNYGTKIQKEARARAIT